MTTEPRSRKPFNGARKIVRNFLVWIIPCAGFFFAIALTVSPWFAERLNLLFENTVHGQAHVQSCELLRNGYLRAHAVQCAFSHEYEGTTYHSKSEAWASQSPFVTRDSLDRVLAEQSAKTSRTIAFRQRDPADAVIIDERWLAMPAPWALLLPFFVGLFVLLIYLEPATTYRRAELELDPVTGELLEINNKRKNRRRRLAARWSCAIALAMLACFYSLSNRVSNAVSMAGFSGLRETPARLFDCDHRRRGGHKGHDQIECAFQYQWHGQTLHGRAEALDFRSFPTNTRMDAEVERLKRNGEVTAYVDPRHPAYAWAFLANDWFVSYSWGITDLILLVLSLAVLPGLLIYFLWKTVTGGRSS